MVVAMQAPRALDDQVDRREIGDHDEAEGRMTSERAVGRMNALELAKVAEIRMAEPPSPAWTFSSRLWLTMRALLDAGGLNLASACKSR